MIKLLNKLFKLVSLFFWFSESLQWNIFKFPKITKKCRPTCGVFPVLSSPFILFHESQFELCNLIKQRIKNYSLLKWKFVIRNVKDKRRYEKIWKGRKVEKVLRGWKFKKYVKRAWGKSI